jgi:hypothetical protein
MKGQDWRTVQLSSMEGTCLDCERRVQTRGLPCALGDECHEIDYDYDGYPSRERYILWVGIKKGE